MPRCFHGMMFLLTFCAAALGQESTPTLDRLPTSSDPLKPLAGPVELHSSTTAGHLLDAADSLRRAGRNEAADAIQKEAEQIGRAHV